MDTRVNIYLLLDHEEFYGEEKSIEQAKALIANIPSITLLNYFSGFSVNLYLAEKDERPGQIQNRLASSLMQIAGKELQEKWKTEVSRIADAGHSPMMFWTYSNLLFYNLIFQSYNTGVSRDLRPDEAKNVFDAYLIINSIANKKTKIDDEVFLLQGSTDLDEILIANFVYQRDYTSTTDFSNQVVRGMKFFQYLESHDLFGHWVIEFYKIKNVRSYLRMARNIMSVFIETGFGTEARKQVIDLTDYLRNGAVDLDYIETLCINSRIGDYEEDENFSLLRNKPLFRITRARFFILDMNFLIDQLYKAQVFAFNGYLKSNNVCNDFLSIKAKEFLEDIYLPTVIQDSFPHYVKYFGVNALNSTNGELCDVYLRNQNRVVLIEAKDVLLGASPKNSSDRNQIKNELEKKFIANQKGKPKGISQLFNALKDIEKNGIGFDNLTNEILEVFPIILYTDNSFGQDGINRVLNLKFKKLQSGETWAKLKIHDLTLISLSYFELHGEYFEKNLLDLCTMICEYHKHIDEERFSSTPFEVFSRFYMKQQISEDLKNSKSFDFALQEILASK